MSEALRQQGVEYFWWLGPEEPIAAEDGRLWPLGTVRARARARVRVSSP